jgi:hypothetical protein
MVFPYYNIVLFYADSVTVSFAGGLKSSISDKLARFILQVKPEVNNEGK